QDDRHDVGLRRRRAAGRPRLLRGAGQAEGVALPGDHHGLGLAGQRPVMARLVVFRWAPGEPERIRAYEVQAVADTTVLDALVAVQREQDPTLALRYACRVGMCGSCAMVVNGRERWACRTRLASLGPGPVRVRPLYHFPLQRDRRDAGHAARWARLLGDDALPRCHGQGNCTDVCPMGLSPTRSIIRLRQLAVRRLLGLP